MIVYTSNQPGSGKSLLVKMALAPVWGDASSTDFPITERGKTDTVELRKELASAAIERRAYLWLDDGPARVASSALNRFVTSSRHRARILGCPGSFDEPNVTQLFLTSNFIEITTDLQRRALVVELFYPGEIEGRRFRETIDEPWLIQDAHRKSTLSALWALVREWNAAGGPRHEALRPQGFSSWGSIVGGIVRHHFRDPLVAADLPMAGDVEGEQLRTVLVSLIDELPDGEVGEFTPADVAHRARGMGVLPDVVGMAGEPEADGRQRRALGRRLMAYRGRHLMDNHRRVACWGSRRQNSGTVYRVTFPDA